jgi:hypothetical protein
LNVSRPPRRRVRVAACVLLGALFAAQVGAGLRVHSGTCDELAAHIPSGILAFKTGQPRGGVANPPLGQLLVATGPVLSGGADHPLRDRPRDLLPARLPIALLGALTVAATGLLASRLAGPAAGIAAAAAAVASPDLVAHSGLATLDVPVTAFLAAACLFAWRWARGSRWSLAGWAAAIAAACLTKSSALHFLPATALGAALLPGSARARAARAASLLLTGAAATGAAAWLLYGPGPADWLLPAPYAAGLRVKLAHAAHGHFSYLLGERSASGFPHYYVVALAVKTPLALQIAAAVGAWALARRRTGGDPAGFACLVLLPAIWLIAALSLVHRVHIGVRHVLPALPALLALAGAGAVHLARAGRPGRLGASVLAAWAAWAAASITPDHLAYFHELVGGPGRGDAVLIDSNLDWGQDEGRFRAWARGRGVTVNPDRPTGGIVAANVNALRGILSRDDLRLRWLRRLEPERTFGHTFRVYRVSEPALRAAAARDPLARLDWAWWLVGVGRPREALEELAALEASDLPRHPVHGRGYWRVRGEALLLETRFDEARDAAERAAEPDLVAEIDHRRRVARGERPEAAEAARAIRALSRRGHPEEASRLGRAFGADPLAPPAPGAAPRWTEASRLKALGREREALEVVGQAIAADPTNDAALQLYGELVVRRKLGLTEFEWPVVDWSRIAPRPRAP